MREPKPFFRKQTSTWYVQIGKKQHNLGPDEQVAKQKYHALMAGRQPVTDETTVYSVLFQFLGWNKEQREGSTHEFYRQHIDWTRQAEHGVLGPTVHSNGALRRKHRPIRICARTVSQRRDYPR